MPTNFFSDKTMPLISSMQLHQIVEMPKSLENMLAASKTLAQLQTIQKHCESLKIDNNLTGLNSFQESLASYYQTDFINEYDIKQDADHSLADSDSEESVESDSFRESSSLGDSTSSLDINAANHAFETFLNKKTSSFIWNLLHVDFEDGVSNDIIEDVNHYLNENKHVTICWLNSIFSQHQTGQDILAALLRIVAMTIPVDDSDKLLPLVIAGLLQPSSKTQEAALAVIEEWRTKPCLHALQNLEAHSNWIKKYATIVKRELEDELNAH